MKTNSFRCLVRYPDGTELTLDIGGRDRADAMNYPIQDGGRIVSCWPSVLH